MDYTQYKRTERPLTGGRWNETWWASREETKRGQRIVDAAFREQIGPRTKFEHNLFRFCMRETEGYGIGAVMWKDYITVYKNNVTVFSTLWDDNSVTFDGWMYHHEILQYAIQMDDIGNRVVTGPLHPMTEKYMAR